MTDHDAIAEMAYFKWEKAGKPDGMSDHFWAEAEIDYIYREHDALCHLWQHNQSSSPYMTNVIFGPSLWTSIPMVYDPSISEQFIPVTKFAGKMQEASGKNSGRMYSATVTKNL